MMSAIISVSSLLRNVQSGVRKARSGIMVGITPSRWALWSSPKAALAWILAWEGATVGAAILAISSEDVPDRHAWLLFGGVLLAAMAYMIGTRPFAERRRGNQIQQGRVEYVEQTSIWFFSAALMLPAAFVIVLVILVRIRHYYIARTPLFRDVFTVCSILLSALATHAVARLTPTWNWLHGDPHASEIGGGLGIVLAVAAYFLVQAILVGVARGLANMGLINGRSAWSITGLIGTFDDNVLILYTLLLAIFATVAEAFASMALIAVVLVAIGATRTQQRLEQIDVERQQLQLDALQDALTELPNRRGFEPQAQLALITDQAHGEPTAVLMADLDHFKDWNTRLGHFGADHLLKAVARTVRAQTRSADLLCRWGGEEIAIVLPGTDRTQAWLLAERIRVAVEAMTIRVTKPAGGAPMTVTGCTLSIGGTVSTSKNSELDALQEIADQELQCAKDTGRNRVCFDGMEPGQIVTDTKLAPKTRTRVFALRRHS